MTVTSLRLLVQHIFFVIFTYGGYFRVSLGGNIPCLSCPFVYSCGGYCYLMLFQRALGTLFVPLVTGGSAAASQVLTNLQNIGYGFLIFGLFVIVLGKTWCGWLCPFGVLQDWVTRLRKWMGIRESEIILRNKMRLSWLKYAVLAYTIIVPLIASTRIISNEFILAFCNICPAKALMPLFEGDTRYLAIDVSNTVSAVFSVLLLAITSGMLVGMFFKERFFCLFCPMLALNNLFKKLYLLRLIKDPKACHGCGSCRRTCAMDNETVYRERISSNVYDADCMACFKCTESCAADKTLSAKFGPFKLFSSTRRYAARLSSKVKL